MSDRVYTPDRWQPVKLTYNGQVSYKILGTWYGGYTTGDSWRFSSGVTDVHPIERGIEVVNESGSIYRCYEGGEGMGGYTSGIYASFKKQADESNGTIQIELVDKDELISKFPNAFSNSAT